MSSSWTIGVSAHPRSRGENEWSLPTTPEPVWLIPAHAGKTPAASAWAGSTPAHPRSRGENLRTCAACLSHRGSSPLTRGKHGRETLAFHPARLIPAHAGKTSSRLTLPSETRAHPRSRGENVARGDKVAGAFGSSPLTRGKLVCPRHVRPSAGLIPAHAGKTRGPRFPED